MIVLHAGYRRCTGCRCLLPCDEFNAKTRGPDGRPRTYQSRCRPCAAQRQRELTGAKPRPPRLSRDELRRRQRERRVAYVDTIKSDPVTLAEWLAKRRMDAKLARDRRRGGPGRVYPLRRKLAGSCVPDAYVGPSAKEVLPAEPLRRYLEWRFPEHEPGDIWAAVGFVVSDKSLRRLFHERQPVIELDMADRILTLGLGRPDLLNALYPVDV